jgi:hypothetical protein
MVYLRRLLVAAVFIGVACLAYVFPTSNAMPVSLGLDWPAEGLRSPDVPLWVVVSITYLLGLGTASAAFVWKIMKQGLAGRRYRKAVAGLESEIHQLRNLPLEGADAVGADPALVASVDKASIAKPGA